MKCSSASKATTDRLCVYEHKQSWSYNKKLVWFNSFRVRCKIKHVILSESNKTLDLLISEKILGLLCYVNQRLWPLIAQHRCLSPCVPLQKEAASALNCSHCNYTALKEFLSHLTSLLTQVWGHLCYLNGFYNTNFSLLIDSETQTASAHVLKQKVKVKQSEQEVFSHPQRQEPQWPVHLELTGFTSHKRTQAEQWIFWHVLTGWEHICNN